MNKDTGKIYRTPAEMEAAIRRGEVLVSISDVAQAAHTGDNRKERRRRMAANRGSSPIVRRARFKVRK